MKDNIWNYVVNKSEYVLNFRLFKVANTCPDDSPAHSRHSPNQPHEVITWNGFQLTGVPCQELISTVSCILNVFEYKVLVQRSIQ